MNHKGHIGHIGHKVNRIQYFLTHMFKKFAKRIQLSRTLLMTTPNSNQFSLCPMFLYALYA